MKQINNRILSILLLLLCHISLSAQTVTIYRGGVPLVPTYSTVAAAIVASINGDTLKLSAHTFNEHDLYVNKNISLLGTMTSTDTSIIDAKRLGRCIEIAGSKSVSIVNVHVVNGYAIKGGGILIDSAGNLTLGGYTVISNSEGIGGGIFGYIQDHSSDSIVVKLKDKVIINNNIGGGIQLIGAGSFDNTAIVYLGDDVQIVNNEGGGINTQVIKVYGIGHEGGVRINYNHSVNNGAGFSTNYLYLYSTLTVSFNKSDSVGGGFCKLYSLNGNGRLLVSNNTAKYGGGGANFGYKGGDSATVILCNNHAVYGGGVYLSTVGDLSGSYRNSNLEISNNTADSIGGGIYMMNKFTPISSPMPNWYKVNLVNNHALKYNGLYVKDWSNVAFTKCRFFNPDLSGAHTNEVYINNNVFFQSDSCWFGESDTTGLIIKDASSAIALNRYVQCDWRVNNGAPIVALPFPVSAQFRLSTGASLPSYSFMMLQGRYSGTMGSFSPALASITSTGKVESIFTASGTGTANLMGIVDADTFKANVSVKLGVMDPSLAQLRIYPNPTQSILYIEGLPASCTLVLFDMLGKQVVQKVINESGVTQLDLAGLASGNYVVQISSSDGLLGTATISKP
jgi:hypothetical protein